MSKKSLLIKDAMLIVTLDKERKIIKGGNVYIEGPEIIAVGESKEVSYSADRVIDARGKIVIPGMVNTHHHLDEALLRVVPKIQHLPLYEWGNHLYKLRREETPEHIYVASLVGLGELLLTGCTMSSNFSYIYVNNIQTDKEIEAARDLGIRFHPVRGSITRARSSSYDDVVQDLDTALKDSERVIRKHHDTDKFSMCRIGIGPSTLLSTTIECLEETKKMAEKHEGVLRHTHFAEVVGENKYCLETYGKSNLQVLKDAGWLGRDVWLTHVVHVNSSAIEELASTGTGVAHCPRSNMRLSSGVAPVPEMLRNGMNVGLGVDGSSSNDTSSMLAEMQAALLVHKLTYGADSITATEVLEIAALGGARVLHREAELGSIEAGKGADIVLIDFRQLGFAGANHDPVAALAYCGDKTIVDTTIVNGEIVVSDGRLVKVDEEELYDKANELASDLVNKAEKRTGEEFLYQKWRRAFP